MKITTQPQLTRMLAASSGDVKTYVETLKVGDNADATQLSLSAKMAYHGIETIVDDSQKWLSFNGRQVLRPDRYQAAIALIKTTFNIELE